MKHKYIVIKEDGELISPKAYSQSSACPPEFKVVIEREALGIKVMSQGSNAPEYLKYANKLGFQWEPAADIGFVQYNYKADLIMRLAKEYARQLVHSLDLPIYEVKGSNFFDLDYPVVKAYAGLFGDRLFKHKNGKKELVMSYDASYPQFNLASKAIIKDAAMPFAHFSISDCYRYEQRGECMLLYRGRRFFMPDIHSYLRDIPEAFDWYFKLEEKLLEAAQMAKRQYWNLVKVSSEENWDKYHSQISMIAIRNKKPVLVEIRRDGVDRYWIIDVDYSIVDKLQQVREIGCIQIDIGNAKRLGISYHDSKGQKRHPVIIHSAIPGGIERFVYMLFDNFKESFPFWLHPVQVRVLPVGEKYVPFAQEFAQHHAPHLRIEIDDRAESVAKKVKRAHQDLVPEIVVIGDKEMSDPDALQRMLKEMAQRNERYPFIELGWPRELSRQLH